MLPIGIQSLREIRRLDCYYVDKTPYLMRLVREGKYYFLSRPRRFGKSLLLDTLKELFEGGEELFRGLAVHGGWDWSASHPVLRISFGSGRYDAPGLLEAGLADKLEDLEQETGAGGGRGTAAGRFEALIKDARRRAGRRVVVLVDEYDKPILDALSKPEVARANRDFLRGFYGVVKDCDEHVRFAFLTGVSKFSKAGLFSGLNNLRDITLDPGYGAICGYTERDLDEVFAPELEDLDRDEIRRWYDGYGWRGAEKVYNPFDVLLLLQEREFKAHWFETGTPSFLVDALLRRGIPTPEIGGRMAGEGLLSTFDVDEMPVEALMFQTGYLTIAGEEGAAGRTSYRLDYPNHEVRLALNERLLRAMLPDPSRLDEGWLDLRRLAEADDLEGVRATLEAFLAGIPHEWHARSDVARHESYWASLMYSLFVVTGLDVRVEESVAGGRLDMAVLCPGHVHVYEFKVVGREPEERALAQMREKGYADKYRRPGVPVRLIGVEFSREKRNIAAFEVEDA